MKLLLLLTILPIFFISVYADPVMHETATANNILDIPGCLETEIGCYTPNILTLDVGHMVTMLNFDMSGTLHTYTSGVGIPDGTFDSGILVIGQTFHWTTDTVGEYPYYCTFHPWMQGMIIVEPQEIFVEIDKSIYYMDEPILLTGEVEELVEGQALHLEMMDSREVIIFSDQLTVGADKKFSTSLATGVERMIIGNHFKITLVYGEKHAQVIFEYYDTPNPIPAIPDESEFPMILDELVLRGLEHSLLQLSMDIDRADADIDEMMGYLEGAIERNEWRKVQKYSDRIGGLMAFVEICFTLVDTIEQQIQVYS